MHLEISTNGFFDDTRCQFVGDFFHAVMLSLDGPADIQNRQRPGKGGTPTFERVFRNARQLAASTAEVCLRTCVTADTVFELEGIAHWMCKEFQPAAICFEPLQDIPGGFASGLTAPGYLDFARMLVRSERVAESYGVPVVYDAASIDKVRHTFCPVGRDTVILSPEGTFTSCYQPEKDWAASGLDLRIGGLDRARCAHVDPVSLQRVRDLTNHPERCRTCVARWHCAGGCRVRQTQAVLNDLRNEFCARTRALVVHRLLRQLSGDPWADEFLADSATVERAVYRRSDGPGDSDA